MLCVCLRCLYLYAICNKINFYLLVFSYVSVGELWAFTIGWNMLLENIIGAASTGKAWSEYFDSLINGTIRR